MHKLMEGNGPDGGLPNQGVTAKCQLCPCTNVLKTVSMCDGLTNQICQEKIASKGPRQYACENTLWHFPFDSMSNTKMWAGVMPRADDMKLQALAYMVHKLQYVKIAIFDTS